MQDVNGNEEREVHKNYVGIMYYIYYITHKRYRQNRITALKRSGEDVDFKSVPNLTLLPSIAQNNAQYK